MLCLIPFFLVCTHTIKTNCFKLTDTKIANVVLLFRRAIGITRYRLLFMVMFSEQSSYRSDVFSCVNRIKLNKRESGNVCT